MTKRQEPKDVDLGLAGIKDHPLAMIFDMMEDLTPIIDDMKANGYDKSQPIVLYEGMILDGRNRRAAALVAGVEPNFFDYEGDDPIAFVIRANLNRRHLTESQRGMVAARIAKLGAAQICAAEGMSVHRNTVGMATKVQDRGTPELASAVDRGKVSVSDAAAIADRPPEEQRRALDAVKNGTARTLRRAVEEDIPFDGEAAPEPPPCDKNGVPWPERALPAIAARKELDGFIREILNEGTRRVEQLRATQLRNSIDFSSVSDHLRRIKDACLTGKPYAVCPYCKGGGKSTVKDRPGKCAGCNGDGWVTSSTYSSAPKD